VLNADRVLVTIGTPCTMSAVGSTLAYRARVRGDADAVLYAAFDAGLVDLAAGDDGTVTATWADGAPATVADIDERCGSELRARSGIRVDERFGIPDGPAGDVSASLPYDLAEGGLRRQLGITFGDIRSSGLRDMHTLFDDDPRLGPSLQAQLFLHGGLGALAALPVPLAELLPDPFGFRVAAASAFGGLDALARLHSPADAEAIGAGPRDKFAARLANALGSHGPALISAMLAPSYPLSRSMKRPELLQTLEGAEHFMRVPQAPVNAVGACAASLIALAEVAPQLVLDYPGFRRPQLALWTAADAATRPGGEIIEAFGTGALLTTAKLAEVNTGRAPSDRRSLSDALAPFDVDACGTVVGDGGSGVIVTTLDFAVRNFLDVTSIIAGWGQSGEAGGKAHFAGVGFGGENALVHAFELAAAGHGYGVADFGYLVAHATGTRTNSKTDLATAASGRRLAAARAGRDAPLPPMAVGTPKALGDGHTMGETGLKAVAQAIDHLLGQPSVGVPTLRTLDPELGSAVEQFELSRRPVDGNADGGAVCATQGFGGYNGAVALKAANADSIGRYGIESSVLGAYLERWPELRRERERRELAARTTRGSARQLAELHRWPGSPS
jgi:3-oxoacyl-(acyl-carrier-protein) synthase